jgi:hypothetical protein
MPITLENLERVWAARSQDSLDELEEATKWIQQSDLMLTTLMTMLLCIQTKGSIVSFLVSHSAICLKLGYEIAKLEELERMGKL